MSCSPEALVYYDRVVGDKLFEASEVAVKSKIKTQNVIEELEIKVEFPDLRKFVNLDKIDFNRVLEIRKKATKFREWLQSESERVILLARFSSVTA